MFRTAIAFAGDISKWDVSSVTSMKSMFWGALSFNGDISKWDVSSVKDMDGMLFGAVSFKHALCGTAWVNSTASKNLMFAGPSESIPQQACAPDLGPTERELMIRPLTSTSASIQVVASAIERMMTCLECGAFTKSGRVSCCAPGGAWFKNCGASGHGNAAHTWSEGVKACARTFDANVNADIYNIYIFV